MSDALDKLFATIAARKDADPGMSYTAKLLAEGVKKCAKKFGEEAVEVVIAAMAGEAAALKAEAADVLYHLLVLLESRDVALDDVFAVLEGRMGTSGLEEKAARNGEQT